MKPVIKSVKHKIKKLFPRKVDEYFGDKKALTSKEADREIQASVTGEQKNSQFRFLDSTFSDKGYRYFPALENCTTSHLSPVVLAYTHIDGELLKDLGLSKPE